jgi:hypothetical protein
MKQLMTTRLSMRDNSVGFSDNDPPLHGDARLWGRADDSWSEIFEQIKSIHTNHKLNALSIKYYNFCSSFDITEFLQRKLHVDTEAIHSMIQEKHLVLRCHHQKRSMSTGSPITWSNRWVWTSHWNRPRHHQKIEKNYVHIIRSIRQGLSN